MPGLTIDDTARLLSHATWLERRLFEVLGGWVAETPEPAVKLAFARHSRQHGLHAEALEPLRPSTRDHDASQRAPVDASWRTQVSKMLAASTTGARLERLQELLSEAIALYDRHLSAMRPVRDAPVRRVLGAVTADGRAELEDFAGLRRIDAGTGP